MTLRESRAELLRAGHQFHLQLRRVVLETARVVKHLPSTSVRAGVQHRRDIGVERGQSVNHKFRRGSKVWIVFVLGERPRMKQGPVQAEHGIVKLWLAESLLQPTAHYSTHLVFLFFRQPLIAPALVVRNDGVFWLWLI